MGIVAWDDARYLVWFQFPRIRKVCSWFGELRSTGVQSPSCSYRSLVWIADAWPLLSVCACFLKGKISCFIFAGKWGLLGLTASSFTFILLPLYSYFSPSSVFILPQPLWWIFSLSLFCSYPVFYLSLPLFSTYFALPFLYSRLFFLSSNQTVSLYGELHLN